jgi:hypothetical protein
MGAMDHKVLTALLLSFLSIVLVVAISLVFMVLHFRHRRILLTRGRDKSLKTPLYGQFPERHFTLKRPNCWLAIKNRNLASVQTALALHNPKPCSLAEGLSADADQKLFVSPPVSGWILVVGSALPDANDDVDACFRFLLDLSRKLGHVQFFSVNSMLNHHTWVQAETGRIMRAYAWAGKTFWNQGNLTQAETDLGMKCYDYFEVADLDPFATPEPGCNNSDKIHLLAARWSLDPDEIDERFIEREWGIVGDPSGLF